MAGHYAGSTAGAGVHINAHAPIMSPVVSCSGSGYKIVAFTAEVAAGFIIECILQVFTENQVSHPGLP